MRSKSMLIASLVSLLTLPLTSCMVGPNFHTPIAPQVTSFTEGPAPTSTITVTKSATAGTAQQFIAGRDISGDWWQVFHSPAINELIATAITNSPNLVAAKATLVQAQENLTAQVGGTLLPTVNLPLNAMRQQVRMGSVGTAATPSLFNLYNASVNVSYALDIFGALRRQIEATRAQVTYEQYELAAAYVTLTSNIVTTAIAAASYRAQIEATSDIVKSLQRELTIMQQQRQLGGVSGNDVLTQTSQLAATQAQLPALQQGLVQARHALATLVGAMPATFVMPEIRLQDLHLPSTLPLSIPSRLVKQRPDVQAAEALMAVANAQVGVATANLFPQITLTGAYGFEALQPANLFKSVNAIWSGSAGLLQPIFAGGSLQAKRRAAQAGYAVAYAQYQQTVLQAFQNVADTIRALEHDAQIFKFEKDNELAASKSLRIDRRLYKLGGVNYTTLLLAEKQYQQAVISRVQAQAARYVDTAALFQALGGGWWNADATIRLIKPAVA